VSRNSTKIVNNVNTIFNAEILAFANL